jgi:hypothetical protein
LATKSSTLRRKSSRLATRSPTEGTLLPSFDEEFLTPVDWLSKLGDQVLDGGDALLEVGDEVLTLEEKVLNVGENVPNLDENLPNGGLRGHHAVRELGRRTRRSATIRVDDSFDV